MTETSSGEYLTRSGVRSLETEFLVALAQELDPESGPLIPYEPSLPAEWSRHFRAVTPTLIDDWADHHHRFGEWIEELEPGVRPDPFIAIWSRAHGKSTILEHAIAYAAEQKRRRFALYVCDTFDAAVKHVQAIQTLLERIGPPVGQRLENVYGHSKGWARAMLRSAMGFNCVPFGLDQALRGVKLDEYRPDLIAFDDVDGRHDSIAVTKKKIEILTETILPAGTADLAIVGVQNLITATGLFTRMAGLSPGLPADFLATRIVSGPVRAVEGLQTEVAYLDVDPDSDEPPRAYQKITGGRATWSVHSLEACQRYILDFGYRAFAREMQHDVLDVEGALWTTETLNGTRVEVFPALSRKVVAVDPPVSSKSSSDECGIIAAGRTTTQHGYVIADRSGILSPAQWGRRAVLLHDEVEAYAIVAEKNQGGEMVADVIRNAARSLHLEGLRETPKIRIRLVHASVGKRARAEPVAAMYEEGMIHHVGALEGLERQMTTWNAQDGSESPDRIDATVYAMFDLGVVRDVKPTRGYYSITEG